MKYVGIQTQIRRNNRKTFFLLLMFPVILLGIVLLTIMAIDWMGIFSWQGLYTGPDKLAATFHWPLIWKYFYKALPYTLGVTGVWFIIAYFANTAIIRSATHAKPTERKENIRVYNIVENLCVAGGIEMPKINIIQDDDLNAFASGIDINSYTITLTTGIIEKLDDDELSAVVGHELTHIKNRDTRLMVVCIVFVGIFSTLIAVIFKLMRGALHSSRRSRNKNNGSGVIVFLAILLVALVWCTVGYAFTTLTRLAISRKREYVADAGGAELCQNPLALASALKKISQEPGLSRINRDDVAQLYIVHPDEEGDEGIMKGLLAKVNVIFCTHPDTPERIALLEQF